MAKAWRLALGTAVSVGGELGLGEMTKRALSSVAAGWDGLKKMAWL
jgi:hypothetical protein